MSNDGLAAELQQYTSAHLGDGNEWWGVPARARHVKIELSAWDNGSWLCLATTKVPAHAGFINIYLIEFSRKFVGITQPQLPLDMRHFS